MSIVPRWAKSHFAPIVKSWTLAAALPFIVAAPSWCQAQPQKLPGPPEIPEVKLVPDLHTIPVPHDRTAFNVQMVNAVALTTRQRGDLGPRFRVQAATDQDRRNPR